MLEKLRVGVIVSTHGLKGELKVQPGTEEPERFLRLKRLTVRPGSSGMRRAESQSETELEIEGVRFQKDMVLIRFKGIDSIEEAERLRGYALYIDRSEAIELAEGEYFLGDYFGLRVLNEDGSLLGTVKDVLETGANLVFVTEKQDGGELLIPKIPGVMLELSPENGYMRVHLLEGLLDL